MRLIENLKWRYATKQFDATKKVEAEKIEQLKEAIQLSASSLGLQPYVVLEVKSPEIRQQLLPVSWGQSSITEASNLFVFCNMTSLSAAYIEACAELHRSERQADVAMRERFISVASMILQEKSAQEQEAWSRAETFIAVGTALSACADLRIDACPIGGFSPKEYNQILGLDAKGLNAALVLAVGYRSEADQLQHAVKVRKPSSLLFQEI